MSQYYPSVTPGAIIGYRKNGAPIRLIAGGNGEGDGGTEGNGGDGTPGGDAGSTGNGQQEGQDGGSGGSGGRSDPGPGTGTASGSGGSQPAADDTPRVIAALREDFKGERARRQATEKALADFRAESERKEAERAAAEAERNKRLAIALGVASEDEPPDPAKLAEELERTRAQHADALAAKDAEVRQRDIRLAVLTQAPGLGANGALLMDSVSFLGKLADLDPVADGFSEELAGRIKAAADANPSYKVTAPKPGENGNVGGNGSPQPPRSGGEFNGAPGGNRQLTVEDVDRMSPSEVVTAGEQGLLTNLGYHPKRSRR